MEFFRLLISRLSIITFLSIFFTSSAFATGGTITFTIPGPTSVPTLSGTMLIVLSLLLFVVAFKVANQKNSNAGKFFIALVGMTAIISGSGGIKMISEVNAGGASIAIPDGSTTYSERLDPNVQYEFNNRDYKIITVTILPDADSTCGLFGGASGPSCSEVGTLAETEYCRIECRATTGGDGMSGM